MSEPFEAYELQHRAEVEVDIHAPAVDLEGQEERAVMERKLVYKLDMRMCILVIIYILNYVSCPYSFLWNTFWGSSYYPSLRLFETMCRK